MILHRDGAVTNASTCQGSAALHYSVCTQDRHLSDHACCQRQANGYKEENPLLGHCIDHVIACCEGRNHWRGERDEADTTETQEQEANPPLTYHSEF